MAVRPAEFRRAMGRLATGVTVLTTPAPPAHRVMTANAVMSVSLEPVLLVAGVRVGSAWSDAARAAGMFAVNVLGEHQEALSRWCAGSARHTDPDGIHRHPHGVSERGLLLFDGALAVFECRLHGEFRAGDHDLLLGEVVALEDREGGNPLVYFASDYASVATRATT